MTLRRCIGMALLVVSLGLATIQFWVAAVIYCPTALYRTDPRVWGLRDAAAMKVSYGDGTAITGWWSPARAPDAPVVLLVHGRSENISSRSSVMRDLAAQGMIDAAVATARRSGFATAVKQLEATVSALLRAPVQSFGDQLRFEAGLRRKKLL